MGELDVFGSATTPSFDEVARDDDYFSLKEGLESILGRPAHLVTRSSIQNPYFLQRVESTRDALYGA